VADRLPDGTQPAIGGAILGLIALASPYALTNGELQINHLTTTGALALTFVVAAVAKFAAAAVAMATGWRGGFIIPLFFVGFALGQAADGHIGPASTWVLSAGLMVACNVGVTKTPIGSTLVVTEMSGTALLPTTLVAALVSLTLTSHISLIHSQRRRFVTRMVDGDEGGGDAHDLPPIEMSGRPAGSPPPPVEEP
jgi:H+/Cl- antiporter ClcA